MSIDVQLVQEDGDTYCVVRSPPPCAGVTGSGGPGFYGKISYKESVYLADEQFRKESRLRNALLPVCARHNVDLDAYFVFADRSCSLEPQHVAALLDTRVCNFIDDRSTMLLVPAMGRSLQTLRERYARGFPDRAMASATLVAVVLLLDAGYQHNDLAARNIVIDDQTGQARLIDFHTTDTAERGALSSEFEAVCAVFPDHRRRITRCEAATAGASLQRALRWHRRPAAATPASV